MLQHLKISKLFGLYDYDLCFSNSVDDRIRFITATNGYGKSTILRLIDGLFNNHLDVFFKIPFESIEYNIDDAILLVTQTTNASVNEDYGDSDLPDKTDDVCIQFGFGMQLPLSFVKLTSLDINKEGHLNIVYQQIQMFFSSETCKFIDDRRLLRENEGSSELVRLADLLKKKMQDGGSALESQMGLLKEIVDRSFFANKHMELSPLFGFRFVADDEKKTKLAMSDLSSGEQHIMLITLYMLFDAPEKAIVLIDEPEMSFHLSWQGDYLSNLRKLVALRNVQCIIATHSPIIFGSEYDLSIDLFDQMNP